MCSKLPILQIRKEKKINNTNAKKRKQPGAKAKH